MHVYLLHLYVSADENYLDILYLYYQDVKTKLYGHARSCLISAQCLIVKFGPWHIQYTVWKETVMVGKFGKSTAKT